MGIEDPKHPDKGGVNKQHPGWEELHIRPEGGDVDVEFTKTDGSNVIEALPESGYRLPESNN